jgi:hypothetical protein
LELPLTFWFYLIEVVTIKFDLNKGGIGMLVLFIIFGFLGAIVALYTIIVDIIVADFNFREFVHYFIIFCTCAGIVFVGFSGDHLISTLECTETEQTNDWELISITEDSKISGKLSGNMLYIYATIDTDETYSFYYKMDNGGIKQGSINAQKATIFEVDDITPHVVEKTIYTYNKMNSVLRFILTFSLSETSSQKNYEFYIPKGSILRTYLNTKEETQ